MIHLFSLLFTVALAATGTCVVVESRGDVQETASSQFCGVIASVSLSQGTVFATDYVTGATTTLVSGVDEGSLSLSPTSDTICFTKDRQLFVGFLATKKIVPIPRGSAHSIRWSPDGNFLIFGVGSGGLFSVRMSNMTVTQLTTQSVVVDSISVCPTSAYASYLWFSPEQKNHRVAVVSLSGKLEPLSIPTSSSGGVTEFSWSPDCSVLALRIGTTLNMIFTDGSLVVLPHNVSAVFWPTIRTSSAIWVIDSTTGQLWVHRLFPGFIGSTQVSQSVNGQVNFVQTLGGDSVAFTQRVSDSVQESSKCTFAKLQSVGVAASVIPLPLNGIGKVTSLYAPEDGSFFLVQGVFGSINEQIWQVDLTQLSITLIHPSIGLPGQGVGSVKITSKNSVLFLLTRQAALPELWTRTGGSSKRLSRATDAVSSFAVSSNGFHVAFTTAAAPFVFTQCLVPPILYSGTVAIGDGESVTISADLIISPNTHLVFGEAAQIVVKGAAYVGGQITLSVTEQAVLTPIVAAVVNGTFSTASFSGNGAGGLCPSGQLQYTSVNVTASVSMQTCGSSFPGWAIAVIVIASLLLLAIPVCVAFSFHCRKRHDEKLSLVMDHA